MGLWFFRFTILFYSFLSWAESPDRVIYGEDDRLDVIHSTDNLMIEKSRSVAGMFKYSSISIFAKNGFKIVSKTLEDRGWCSSERFANQTAASRCTGFLIAEDLLVTAGHCISSKWDCLRFLWVFDYKISSDDQKNVVVPRSSVYRCQSVVKTVYDSTTSLDYAIIKLSRKVTDRAPLNLRRDGKIDKDTPLVLIGHPKGLPLKIAGNAKVLTNTHSNFFITDTDSYGGNSGSPVFNAKTGDVEGILVRGEIDYVTTSEGCHISKICSEGECGGEDVTRITKIFPAIQALISTLGDESEVGGHRQVK
jgi:V8-like Glu-specific endopeptidase